MQRVFLRIPIKTSAKILVDGRLYKKVFINELSTNGLSFHIDKTDTFPDIFELSFYLPVSFRLIKIKMRVMNRSDVAGMIRIGCRFIDILRKDKDYINQYISKVVNFSLPRFILAISSFLFFIDALSRICIYSINLYYESAFSLNLYMIILLLYAAISVIAFISTDTIRKKSFILCIFCVLLAFIFIATKNITYWRLQLWQSPYLFIRSFFWIQTILIIYTGFAIGIGIHSFSRISRILDSFKTHLETSH